MGGIVEGTQKGNEIVQEVNSQAIGYDEVALDDVNPKTEKQKYHAETDPSGDEVNRRFVQPVLNDTLN